jgi:hypothetical protein
MSPVIPVQVTFNEELESRAAESSKLKFPKERPEELRLQEEAA